MPDDAPLTATPPAPVPAGAGDEAAAADSPLRAKVIEALKGVYDPEIRVNIYDLGLVYRVELVGPAAVEIDMTLTAPSCPVAAPRMTTRPTPRLPRPAGHTTHAPPGGPPILIDATPPDLRI